MSELSITLRLENWDESRPLTREEAVEILNLPEEEMPKLLDCAYALRTKYKGKKVSVQLLTNVRSGTVPRTVRIVHSLVIPKLRLKSIAEFPMKNYTEIMIWWMKNIWQDIVLA